MADHIYALYWEYEAKRHYFYVGHTNDIKTRLTTHRRSSKTGSEDKYVYIRKELEPAGVEWNIELIKDIPDGEYPPDYERYYVIQYIRAGHPLKNMKHGDLEKHKEIEEQVADLAIRTVVDVKADRIKRDAAKVVAKEQALYAKSEQLRLKIEAEQAAQAAMTERELARAKEHAKIDAHNAEVAKQRITKQAAYDKRVMEITEARKQQQKEWGFEQDYAEWIRILAGTNK